MRTLDERRSKAFDVVLDTTKLLITLSTAVIGFLASAILINNSNEDSLVAMKKHHCGISSSITLLALCVLFGLFTILKISGILGNETKIQGDKVTIYDSTTRFCFSIMLFLFLSAIGLLGFITLRELSDISI